MLLSLAKKDTGKYSSNCNSAIANSQGLFFFNVLPNPLYNTLCYACTHSLNIWLDMQSVSFPSTAQLCRAELQ